jgi:hypothetical protein
MKRYITHQFPNELKTYALLTLASVLTVVAVTFFLSVSGFSQHVFKTFIAEHPILNFIITPITFVVIIYFRNINIDKFFTIFLLIAILFTFPMMFKTNMFHIT